MISKVINSFLQSIVDHMQKYGIKMETVYNSDLDMISQYTKSLNIRAMFTERQLELLPKAQIESLSKESYILMMYNYSPLRRSDLKFNNINFQVLFDPLNNEELPAFGEMRKVGQDDYSEFFKLIRDANAKQLWVPEVDVDNNILTSSYPEERADVVFRVDGLVTSPAGSPIGPLANGDFVKFDVNGRLLEKVVVTEYTPLNSKCRDLIYGELDLTFKILCSSTEIINNIQFLHVKDLQRNFPVEISLDFGTTVGSHEFEYSTKFEPIDSVGHVDYLSYGNLQHITFSAKITGPFFSFYTQEVPYIQQIEVQIKVGADQVPSPEPRPWTIP